MTIEGIPDGWELLAFRCAAPGEFFLDNRGLPEKWNLTASSKGIFAIIRKIEKPKQFRPFANGDEFLSHPLHEGWVNIGTVGFTKVCKFTDTNFWIHGEIVTCRWEEGFEFIKFRDGTPFGIEVTE